MKARISLHKIIQDFQPVGKGSRGWKNEFFRDFCYENVKDGKKGWKNCQYRTADSEKILKNRG
ncbi:MAG: hypothetical protein IKO52_09985 [Clostridia bacterium]|nr:hypothetical protein [Clostridia bacterium]